MLVLKLGIYNHSNKEVVFAHELNSRSSLSQGISLPSESSIQNIILNNEQYIAQ